MDTQPKTGEDNVSCIACSVYIKKTEGFTCPRCRRGPYCKNHRVPGRRECSSCVIELKASELNALRQQENSIKGLLSLLQFVFIIVAIVFISLKTGISEHVPFLQSSLTADNITLLGVIAVLGYLIFYFIMYNQRRKIGVLEEEIRKTEFRRADR